jgi:hypothetical protein
MEIIWGTEEKQAKLNRSRAAKAEFKKSAAPKGKIAISKPLKLKTPSGPQ